jgi:hypothetical protein
MQIKRFLRESSQLEQFISDEQLEKDFYSVKENLNEEQKKVSKYLSELGKMESIKNEKEKIIEEIGIEVKPLIEKIN